MSNTKKILEDDDYFEEFETEDWNTQMMTDDQKKINSKQWEENWEENPIDQSLELAIKKEIATFKEKEKELSAQKK